MVARMMLRFWSELPRLEAAQPKRPKYQEAILMLAGLDVHRRGAVVGGQTSSYPIALLLSAFEVLEHKV
jgi:hypothetical protein